MSTLRRSLLMLLLATASFGLPACDTTPTGPSTGSGTLLEATINGTSQSFLLLDGFQSYDASAQLARFGGSTSSGGVSRTITATFISDITTGSYPRTLGDDKITITYIESVNGQNETYDCFVHPDHCSITLTGSNGQIVDGTFNVRLTSRRDSTRFVEITNGRFSVRLR